MRVLKLSLGIIFNPVYTFRTIQANRGRLKSSYALVLLALVPVFRLIYLFTVHYPLSTVDPFNADYAVEVATYSIPIISFIIANFCITSIFDGETLLSEALIAGSFSMIPYLIFILPLSAFSQVVSLSEGGIYNFFQYAILAWCVLLTFIGVKEMNQYSMTRTVLIYIIIIISILLILAIALLMYALMNQVITFISGLISEIAFNFKY